MKKKKKSLKIFFKIIFSLIFLCFSLIWIYFSFLFIKGIDSAFKFNLAIHDYVLEIIKTLIHYFKLKGDTSFLKKIGNYSFILGTSVLLVYSSVFFLIQKIPIIGKLLRIITAIIPTISGLSVISGAILIWAI